VDTFAGWMKRMLTVINRNKIVLNLPDFLAGLMALDFDILQAVTLGLFKNTILTRDQLKALKVDSVVSEGAMGLAELGIDPTGAEVVMPEYLW